MVVAGSESEGEETGEQQVSIVSLLPSITEIVAELGLTDQLVGITHECDFPAETVRDKCVVTESYINPKLSQKEINDSVMASLVENNSLYALKEDALQRLRPTHVLTQSLCDVCAVAFDQVELKCARLLQQSRPYKLLSIEPESLEDVRTSIETCGKALSCADESIQGALDRFDNKRSEIRRRVAEKIAQERATEEAEVVTPRPRVAMLEWFDPLFYGGHWIQEMVQDAGGEYSLSQKGERSKAMTPAELQAYDPDVIVLAPCGFNIERCVKDAKAILCKKDGPNYTWWSALRAVKSNRVYCSDGNQFFSRPSPRLVHGIGKQKQVQPLVTVMRAAVAFGCNH
jgi:iron complex transport system substrate-binding protein